MKKRLFSILLILCIVLVMTPTSAFAEGKTETQPETGNAVSNGEGETPAAAATEVRTADELSAAVAAGGTAKLMADIDISASLTINGIVTLDLNDHVVTLTGGNRFITVSGQNTTLTLTDSAETKTERKFGINQDGAWVPDENGDQTVSGGVITGGKTGADDYDVPIAVSGMHIKGLGTLAVTDGTINIPVINEGGAIAGNGTFNGAVINEDRISGGTFNGSIVNYIGKNQYAGEISGGTFYGEVKNGVNAIYNPANGEEALDGKAKGLITGGTFYGKVTNAFYGKITGGSFCGEVDNRERTDVYDYRGTLAGGTFYADNPGTIAEGYCTVTYYAGSYEEPYAVQIVPSGETVTAPANPKLNGLTFGGWYTDEACTDGKEYGFEAPVMEDLTLYAKSLYNIRITDKNGKVYHVTDKNADDVLGDGTVSYTPGYADVGKTLTEDDWNRALQGETVEGFQLPKLTLNDADLKSIRMDGAYGDDDNARFLSMILQIELVGDNTIACSNYGVDAIYAGILIITGSGSLNASATGQKAAAIAVMSYGGAYYQYGGDVTLYGTDSGICCEEARFEFGSGKLTASSSKNALYYDLNSDHFKITSDTTTFYFGSSEKTKFEINAPFSQENIYKQLLTAINEGKLHADEYGVRILYAQLISNHTVTFDTDGGSAVKAQNVSYGETVAKPAKDPVRSGYTFEGWYLGENAYDFKTPVTKDLTVTAHWRYNGGGSSYTYHTIQASVNANGAITPSGKVSIREGSDQSFTITPDPGYDVADVKIDGKSIGAVRSYTFENVKGSHTIEVEIDREEVIKQAKAEELTASIVLMARSVKMANKNVKVRLEMDAESAAAIRELQALGYTVKYKFYRSEKKAWQYEAKPTKTSKVYVNTQGEKGKRYYYKARVLVYDQNGKPVTYSKLTQCKYAARLWTK